jgi:hypothetical protein
MDFQGNWVTGNTIADIEVLILSEWPHAVREELIGNRYRWVFNDAVVARAVLTTSVSARVEKNRGQY